MAPDFGSLALPYSSNVQQDNMQHLSYEVLLGKKDNAGSASAAFSVRWYRYVPVSKFLANSLEDANVRSSRNGQSARTGGRDFASTSLTGGPPEKRRKLDTASSLAKGVSEQDTPVVESGAEDPVEAGRRKVKAFSLNVENTQPDAASLAAQLGIGKRICLVQNNEGRPNARELWVFELQEGAPSRLDLDQVGLEEHESGAFSFASLFPLLVDDRGQPKNFTAKDQPSVLKIKSSANYLAYDVFLRAVQDHVIDNVFRCIGSEGDKARAVKVANRLHVLSDDAQVYGISLGVDVAITWNGLYLAFDAVPSLLQAIPRESVLTSPQHLVLSPLGVEAVYVRSFGKDWRRRATFFKTEDTCRSRIALKERAEIGRLNSILAAYMDVQTMYSDWAVFRYQDKEVVWPVALALLPRVMSSLSSSPTYGTPNAVLEATAAKVGAYVDLLYKGRERERQRREQAEEPQPTLETRTSPPSSHQFLPSFMPVDAFTPRTLSDSYMTPKDETVQHRQSNEHQEHRAVGATQTSAQQNQAAAAPGKQDEQMDADDWDFQAASHTNFWDSYTHPARGDDTNIFESMAGGLTEDDFDFFDAPPVASLSPQQNPAAPSPAIKLPDDPREQGNIFARKSPDNYVDLRTPHSLTGSTPHTCNIGASPGLLSVVADSPSTIDLSHLSTVASPYKVAQTPLNHNFQSEVHAALIDRDSDAVSGGPDDLSNSFRSIPFGNDVTALDLRYNAKRSKKRKRKRNQGSADETVPLRPNSPNMQMSAQRYESTSKQLPARRWAKVDSSDSEATDDGEAVETSVLPAGKEGKHVDTAITAKIVSPDTLLRSVLVKRRRSGSFRLPTRSAGETWSLCAAWAPHLLPLLKATTRADSEIGAMINVKPLASIFPRAPMSAKSTKWASPSIKVVRSNAVVSIASNALSSWTRLCLEPLAGPKHTTFLMIMKYSDPAMTRWMGYIQEVYQLCNLGTPSHIDDPAIILADEEAHEKLANMINQKTEHLQCHSVCLVIPQCMFTIKEMLAITAELNGQRDWIPFHIPATELEIGQMGLPSTCDAQNICLRIYDAVCCGHADTPASADCQGNEIARHSQPAFVLELPLVEKPKLLLSWPVRSLRPLERHRFLHFAYAWDKNASRAVVICTDDAGEGHQLLDVNLEGQDLLASVRQIWHSMREAAAQASIEWRIVVSFLGQPDAKELDAWSNVLHQDLATCEQAMHVSLAMIDYYTCSFTSNRSGETTYRAISRNVYDHIPVSSRLISEGNEAAFTTTILHCACTTTSTLELTFDSHYDDLCKSLLNVIHLGRLHQRPVTAIFSNDIRVDLPWHIVFVSAFM